jgi:uncharacterized membrane protein YqjE
MKPETEQHLLDGIGMTLMGGGFIGLIIDVAWGLWTQNENAITIALVAVGAIFTGLKTLDFLSTKHSK